MAEQTFTLSASSFLLLSGVKRWFVSSSPGHGFITDTALAPARTWLRSINITGSNGRVFLDVDPADLTSNVETNGIFTLTSGSNSVNFGILGADTTEPYAWIPSNANELRAFYNAIGSSNVAATFTLRDGVIPPPTPPGGGIKLGSVLLDLSTVGGLRIGTDDVGGMKIGSDMVYEINEGPSTTPSAHHTYTIVAGGGGNSVGYNGPGRFGSITSGTFTTPSNKAVTITHTRNVGTELNFALTGTSLTATDFPTSIKVTKTTGGEVSLTLEPQSGSFRRLRSPANTWRQDYDPTSGNITSVFVSGQTIRVELFY